MQKCGILYITQNEDQGLVNRCATQVVKMWQDGNAEISMKVETIRLGDEGTTLAVISQLLKEFEAEGRKLVAMGYSSDVAMDVGQQCKVYMQGLTGEVLSYAEVWENLPEGEVAIKFYKVTTFKGVLPAAPVVQKTFMTT